MFAELKRSGDPKKDWEIRMLYDGDCPLCMREVNMLKRRDTNVGKIDFVDISSQDYEPSQNANISYEEVNRLHGLISMPCCIDNENEITSLLTNISCLV